VGVGTQRDAMYVEFSPQETKRKETQKGRNGGKERKGKKDQGREKEGEKKKEKRKKKRLLWITRAKMVRVMSLFSLLWKRFRFVARGSAAKQFIVGLGAACKRKSQRAQRTEPRSSGLPHT